MRVKFKSVLSAALLTLATPGLRAETTLLPIDAVRSTVVAITKPEGFLASLGLRGSEHAILASRWFVTLRVDPADVRKSYVHVTLPAAALEVDTTDARRIAGLDARAPSEEDTARFRDALLGREGFNAGANPEIRFESDAVEPASGQPSIIEEGKRLTVKIRGNLLIRGTRKPLELEALLAPGENRTLRFTGSIKLRQSELGIRLPETRDEIEIRYEVNTKPTVAVAAARLGSADAETEASRGP